MRSVFIAAILLLVPASFSCTSRDKPSAVGLDGLIQAPPPADVGARYNELIAKQKSATFTILFNIESRLGSKRLSNGPEQLLWSQTGTIRQIDEVHIDDGKLWGQRLVWDRSGGGLDCAWNVESGSRSVTGSCGHTDRPIADVGVGALVQFQDGDVRFVSEVAFSGFVEVNGVRAECFHLEDSRGLRIGNICISADGVPMAFDAFLQGETYHVTARAIDVRLPTNAAELGIPLVNLSDSTEPTFFGPVPAEDLRLPDVPIAQDMLKQ